MDDTLIPQHRELHEKHHGRLNNICKPLLLFRYASSHLSYSRIATSKSECQHLYCLVAITLMHLMVEGSSSMLHPSLCAVAACCSLFRLLNSPFNTFTHRLLLVARTLAAHQTNRECIEPYQSQQTQPNNELPRFGRRYVSRVHRLKIHAVVSAQYRRLPCAFAFSSGSLTDHIYASTAESLVASRTHQAHNVPKQQHWYENQALYFLGPQANSRPALTTSVTQAILAALWVSWRGLDTAIEDRKCAC